MEVQNNPSKVNRAIAGGAKGWDAGPLPAYDCSHENNWDNGREYARVYSPKDMTLADGALDSVHTAIGVLRDMNARPGRTGAMRMYIPRKLMDDRATTRFMKMFMAHEDILYGLAANGGKGRTLEHKLDGNYATSVAEACEGYERSRSDWASALSYHSYAVNAETEGFWEIRHLDSSLDADGIGANVQLILGMVKAAIDGTAPAGEAHPVREAEGQPVERRRWNALMDATVGDGPARDKLEEMFVAQGGKFSGPHVSGVEKKALTQLLGDHKLTAGKKKLGDYKDIEDALCGGHEISVRPPQGEAFDIKPERLPRYALAVTGATKQLKNKTRDRLQSASDLAQAGCSFVDSRTGKPLSLAAVSALVAEPGRVTLRHGSQSVALNEGSKRPEDTLAGYLEGQIHVPQRYQAMSAEQRGDVDAARQLGEHGFALGDGAGQVVRPGTMGFLEAAGGGALRVQAPGGSAWMSATRPAVTDWLTAVERPAELSAEQQRALDDAHALAGGGFALQTAGGRTAHDAEVLGALRDVTRLEMVDPAGGRQGVGNNVGAVAATALAPLRAASERHSQLADRLMAIGAEIGASVTVGAQPVPCAGALHWLLAPADGAAADGPGRAAVKLGAQEMADWGQIERVVKLQDEAPQNVEGADGQALASLGRLSAHEVRMVDGQGSAVRLKADQLDRLRGDGLKLVLPKRKWWAWFRKEVTVRGDHKLDKIARRFAE
jgi:hypothetical protein